MTKIIALEGIDGCGKSTTAEALKNFIAQHFPDMFNQIVVMRDPGKTPLGEKLREILLDPDVPVSPFQQLLLFTACRSGLVDSFVAVPENSLIIMDRWLQSTLAYQGVNGIDPGEAYALHNKMLCNSPYEVLPVFSIYLRLRPEDAAERRKDREGSDRFESIGFQHLVFEQYEGLESCGHFDATVDASKPVIQVVKDVISLLPLAVPLSVRRQFS